MSERLYMDAVITPNRSLSPKGLKILLGCFIAYNLVLAVVMAAVGALPVPLFLGLDVVALGIAFAVSNARARRAEYVKVSAEAVQVLRSAAGRMVAVWSSPTAFTRVVVEDRDEDTEVQLTLSGRTLAIAEALSPAEREDFAAALERAIYHARAARG